MNTKALALAISTSLAAGSGAAMAQELDELDPIIDLPSIADLILSELLTEEDTSYLLAIGFSFGFSFVSDSTEVADTSSEALLLGETDGELAGLINTFGESTAMPGIATTTTGLNTVVVSLTPSVVANSDPVSAD